MALIQVNWTPDIRQLRNFGLAGCVVFSLFGLLVLLYGSILGFDIHPETVPKLSIALVVTGMFFLTASALFPAALRPVYIVLTCITLPIGLVLSPIIMAFLYFGVVMPVGLVMRATGWDPMQRKLEPGASTYWIKRELKRTPASYFRQY